MTTRHQKWIADMKKVRMSQRKQIADREGFDANDKALCASMSFPAIDEVTHGNRVYRFDALNILQRVITR